MEHHLLRNSRIKFLDGEELTVTEWGVYVMIGKFDVVFNQSFVFGFARPGRYGHAPEVFSKVLK